MIVLLLVVALIPLVNASSQYFTSGAEDGWLENSTTQSWASLRVCNGIYVSTTGTSMRSRFYTTATPDIYSSIDRFYVQFNTADLPDDAVVTEAKVYLYVTGNSNTFNSFYNTALFGFTPTTYGTAVASDLSLGGTTPYSNYIANNSFTPSSYVVFTLSNLTYVNKTGYTALMAKTEPDATGTPLTWEASKAVALDFSTSETVHPPYFVVTYTVPPTASFSASSTYEYVPGDITFTDTSGGVPSSWAWYLRNTDGGSDTLFSTSQHPTHHFDTAGTYDIKLFISNAAGSDWENRTEWVTLYNMTGTTTSKSITLTYHSANGVTWWEYGLSPTNLPFKTANISGVGVVSTTISGLPLVSGHTYYFRACTVTPYECTSVSSALLATVTPNPETTYGIVQQNISASEWNVSEIGESIVEPYAWTTGSSAIVFGVILFFVWTGLWLRQKEVILPILLGWIGSGLLIYGGTNATGIPPEFAIAASIFCCFGLAGVLLGMIKK